MRVKRRVKEPSKPPPYQPSCLDFDDDFETSLTPRKQRKLWREFRAMLLDEWAGRFPGSRPTLWWASDCPEPRRLIGHEIKEKHFIRGREFVWRDLEQPEPILEPEASYLYRLDLLLTGELEAFRRRACGWPEVLRDLLPVELRPLCKA